MAEEAGEPIVFELKVKIEPEDIDGLGHVNNVVYLRWVQDVAAAHWNSAATEEQRSNWAWVAIRHEIDYLQASFLSDQLVSRTWVGAVSGVRFERFVEIARATDGKPVARSRSMWVAVDPITKRPKRIDPSLNDRFKALP